LPLYEKDEWRTGSANVFHDFRFLLTLAPAPALSRFAANAMPGATLERHCDSGAKPLFWPVSNRQSPVAGVPSFS
jgi:hypothetical protein